MKELEVQEYIQKYINVFKPQWTQQQYLDKIKSSNLNDILQTGFMLNLCLEVLPQLKKENITQIDIYEEYLNIFRKREISILKKNNSNY